MLVVEETTFPVLLALVGTSLNLAPKGAMLVGERILMKTLHRSLVFAEGLDDAEQLNLKGLKYCSFGRPVFRWSVRTAKACLCMCEKLPRQPSARKILLSLKTPTWTTELCLGYSSSATKVWGCYERLTEISSMEITIPMYFSWQTG